MNIAARPGHQLACRNIRLGLPVPTGWRFSGPSWYTQKRRWQPARRFHALGERGAGLDAHNRRMLVWGLYAFTDPYYRPTPTPTIGGVWRTAPATAARIRFLSEFPAPQPRASYPRDHRGAPSGYLFYWRLRRRYHPDRQFHALGRLGILGQGYHERAALISVVYPTPARAEPCAWCGQLNPKGLNPQICAICMDYYRRNGFLLPSPDRFAAPPARPEARRARIATPPRTDPAQQIIDSRRRVAAIRYSYPCALYIPLRPRRRSIFAQRQVTLHYLAVRRYLAAQCLRRGFTRIRTGLWHDQVADVVYLQTTTIEAVPQYIQRGA